MFLRICLKIALKFYGIAMSAYIDMKVTIASARQILHYKNIESLKLDKIKKE
jgi:hypothetical protein